MLSVQKLESKNVLWCKLHAEDTWNSEIYCTKRFSCVTQSRPLCLPFGWNLERCLVLVNKSQGVTKVTKNTNQNMYESTKHHNCTIKF